MNYTFQNQLTYPSKNLFAESVSNLFNKDSLLTQKTTFLRPFEQISLLSDVTNVLYLNWLVPYENVLHLVPPKLKLKKWGKYTILTILTYNHGNFRPQPLNFMKSLFPSPLQSNWRLYLETNEVIPCAKSTCFFLKNVLNARLHTFGSRLFGDILQAHYPLKFIYAIQPDNYTISIQQGLSNAPDLDVVCSKTVDFNFSDEWDNIFSSVEEALKTICLQEYAVADLQLPAFAVASIELPIAIETIKPLQVNSLKSHWLVENSVFGMPFAFLLPSVRFKTISETKIPNT